MVAWSLTVELLFFVGVKIVGSHMACYRSRTILRTPLDTTTDRSLVWSVIILFKFNECIMETVHLLISMNFHHTSCAFHIVRNK